MENLIDLSCFNEGQEVTVVFCSGPNLKGVVCGCCDGMLIIKNNNCNCYYINLEQVKFIRTSARCNCLCQRACN